MNDNVIEGMLLLKKALYKERLQKIILFLLLIFFALSMAILTVIKQNQTIIQLTAVSSLITFLISVLFLRDILRQWNLNKNEILQLIHIAPQNIVWVYDVKVNLMPFGIIVNSYTTLFFRLLNGNFRQIRVSEKCIEKIYIALEIQLPHASFGYSQEKEQWYMANPALLYRD
jgi:hypothetical protein